MFYSDIEYCAVEHTRASLVPGPADPARSKREFRASAALLLPLTLCQAGSLRSTIYSLRLFSSDPVHRRPVRSDLVEVAATFSGSLQKLAVEPLFRKIACGF